MAGKRDEVTIAEVAEALDISKTTVSRAISGKGRVSEATRARVFDYIGKGRQDAAAPLRTAQQGPTNNLALVIPKHFMRLDLPFLRKCMGGVWNMAAQRGYDLLLCYAGETDVGQLERQLESHKVDGVILSRTMLHDECVQTLQRHNVPFVAIGRVDDDKVPQVDNDQVGASAEMTRLLLQLGMRRIAYMGGCTDYTVNADRLRGYLRGFSDCGVQVDQKLIWTGIETSEQRIDALEGALEQKPADFDALLKLLTEMGCEVSRRGKAIRLKAPGWKNVARMDDKLGAGYSETEIRAVLAGEKQHTPRKKSTVQPEPPKVNLLVDIQAKLQAGKGAGYARWAKVFNLKQMAQTVNFLTEHHLLDYTELEEKAVAATAHHNELSAQIKATEKRMAEIAVLRTHIVNYAKTRETYVAYRKAGYSKKFREEHEEEILLHQAAKNAFDEMGVKKLPKVKDLQAEYAKLLEEKKKTYAEYRRSREEMRELLTAKANVDRLLKMDEEQKKEQEKDHGQR